MSLQKIAPLWREKQRLTFTKMHELARFLELSQESLACIDTSPRFILNLPYRLAEKISKDNPNDPIFLQFVPLKKEKEHSAGFIVDPVLDHTFVSTGSLLHKYEGRALIVTTGACAMNCRYCFRQNYDYQASDKQFTKELTQIENEKSIEEVILSGGDPLSLSDSTLQLLLERLSTITHVKRIRFHTRFPMGIPERIDSSFLSLLKSVKKQIWFVIHANHPNEFDDTIWAALKEIQCLGIPVLCQSVLLKGINDDLDTLKKLSSDLVEHGVLPYYLHQLDKVQGAAHFEVPIATGKALIQALTSCSSGYAVPKYVQEIAGKESKTPLS
jgi:EF-P beta-lysylation protein EpmB